MLVNTTSKVAETANGIWILTEATRIVRLSLALPSNILSVLLVFIGFNSCNGTIWYCVLVTIVIVQAIVYKLFVWPELYCLVEDFMNTRHDSDLY